MRELYSIYAKVKVSDKLTDEERFLNIWYDGIVTQDFRGNLPFDKKPEPEEIIDLLKCLRPNKEYYLGGIKIEYIRDLYENEL